MRNFASIAILAGVALAPAAAAAAEVKAEGTATYVTVSSDSNKLADGRAMVTFRENGIIRDNDATSPLNLSAQDCEGTFSVAADGKSSMGGGSCTAVDKDGDVWWLWWTASGGDGKWGAIGGTGKYEGVTGNGTTHDDAAMADRMAITYAGTLTLK
jgi:hypothetical protein